MNEEDTTPNEESTEGDIIFVLGETKLAEDEVEE